MAPKKHPRVDLDKLFNPRSIAIIGASNTPGKVGYALVKNLIDADFDGDVYPINLNEKEVQGLVAYPSVSKVEKTIDVALIAVPAQFVPAVMRECAKKEIKNAIIITAGFAEVGDEGKKIQEELRIIIEENHMNVVGPNTLGVINTDNGFNASFSATYPEMGNLAIVSQSGALCTAILDWARQEKIGFSKFISTGNKAFLNEEHYFSFLEHDKHTKAVLVYMESVKNPHTFIREAARLAKKKPVILIKSGRSSAGQKAASSHTGALSVDDAIFSIACKKANIIRINSIEGFFDMAKVLSKIKKIKGFRLAVVTNAGGPGVIVADSASVHKFPLPQFSPKTLDAVKAINPHASNPLDLIGDAKPIDYRTALKMLQSDAAIDIVYTLLTPQSMTDPERVADVIVALNKRKPIICSFLGGTSVAHPRRYLKEHGVVEYETPERGIKAISRMHEYAERKRVKKLFEQGTKPNKQTKKSLAAKIKSGTKYLTMQETFAIMQEFGIKTCATTFVRSMEELAAAKVTYPVVLKSAVGLPHKTDFGLIKVGVKDAEELAKSAEGMFAKLTELGYKPELAIQEMIKGQEVLASAIANDFGKVLTYGLGGIFVEVMKDVSQKIVPVNDSDIDEMLAEVKGTAVLMGARTKKKYDVESLKKILKSLALLAHTYPEIKEIEFNPVMVTEDGAYAVDAIAVL